MAIAGGLVLAVGFALVIFGSLPIRMSIRRRSALMGIGIALMLFGVYPVILVVSPPRPRPGIDLTGPVCFGPLGLIMGIILFLGMQSRLNRRRRWWAGRPPPETPDRIRRYF